jgi:hypothetical protein
VPFDGHIKVWAYGLSFANAFSHPHVQLRNGAMQDRTLDLRIQARERSKFLSISVVALAVAVRDRPQLTHVRHDDLMAQFLQLLANPDRVRPRFHSQSVLEANR